MPFFSITMNRLRINLIIKNRLPYNFRMKNFCRVLGPMV